MHSESMITTHVPNATIKKVEHVHLCLTIQYIQVLGLTNMFSGHGPSGRARAFTANVCCVMMKCEMESHASALDSLLNSTMVTSDARLLHQPITSTINHKKRCDYRACFTANGLVYGYSLKRILWQ